MDIGVISVRYARALLKSAIDAKAEDAVYTEMQQLAKSYADVPQLRSAINNPMLSKAEKETLLLTAVGKKSSPLVKAFIALVLKEDRESVNGTVEFETEVNPDIIGGFILEYDTYRMDASVKSKLNSILTQLKK